MAQNSVDDTDCGDIFDGIDDFINCPSDGECGGGGRYFAGESEVIQRFLDGSLPDGESLFSDGHTGDFFKLNVSYEDIEHLEWTSAFLEDSFPSRGLTTGTDSLCNKEDHERTSSPVSVLESSSIHSPPQSSTNHGRQKTRRKRPRPLSFASETGIDLISDTSSDFSGKGATIKSPSDSKETMDTSTLESVRKCLHCQVTETPQWRAGPMGLKTLCNACGVRYKSGRLLPEYRPAASPTFIASRHSNSHKKVIEMRAKSAWMQQPPPPNQQSQLRAEGFSRKFMQSSSISWFLCFS